MFIETYKKKLILLFILHAPDKPSLLPRLCQPLRDISDFLVER